MCVCGLFLHNKNKRIDLAGCVLKPHTEFVPVVGSDSITKTSLWYVTMSRHSSSNMIGSFILSHAGGGRLVKQHLWLLDTPFRTVGPFFFLLHVRNKHLINQYKVCNSAVILIKNRIVQIIKSDGCVQSLRFALFYLKIKNATPRKKDLSLHI